MGKHKKQENMPKTPSYDEGRLRDRDLEKELDPNFKPEDLTKLIRKAIKK